MCYPGRAFVEITKYRNFRGTAEGRDPVRLPLQAEWLADTPIVDLQAVSD